MKNVQTFVALAIIVCSLFWSSCGHQQKGTNINATDQQAKTRKQQSAQRPSEEPCNISAVTQKMYENDTVMKQKAEAAYRTMMQNEMFAPEARAGVTDRVIPVVFHIIHQCGDERIGNRQVRNAIKDLNDDFNAANPDALRYQTILSSLGMSIANIGIQFELASIDPYGNATTGITRTEHYFSAHGVSFEDQIKQMIHWPRDKYLNVWVVNTTGGSGYAHYPWTVHHPSAAFRDGIVISYNYLGKIDQSTYEEPYDQGGHRRAHILTHEVGHWLGLQHTWGESLVVGNSSNCNFTPRNCNNNTPPNAVDFNEDGINDTPNTQGDLKIVFPLDTMIAGEPFYGIDSIYGNKDGIVSYSDLPNTCPQYNTCAFSTDPRDHIFNFMDYGCEIMFTEGQKTRMHNILRDTFAQRSLIGLVENRDLTFMDPSKESLMIDTYFFQEDARYNNGRIKTKGIKLVLSTGNFAFTISSSNTDDTYFTVENLPDGLFMRIVRDPNNPKKAVVRLLGKAVDHSNNFDVDNINIVFKPAAFNFDYNLLHNTTISNLEIDFIDYENKYHWYRENPNNEFCVQNKGRIGDYQGLYVDHIGYLALQYFIDEWANGNDEPEGFFLVKEGGVEVEALCHQSNGQATNNLVLFPQGFRINNNPDPSYTYRPIARGPVYGNALMIYGDDYTENAGKSGYIGFKITYDCDNKELYAWLYVTVSADGSSVCAEDAFYNTNPSTGYIITGDLVCESKAENLQVFNYIEEVRFRNSTETFFTHKTPVYEGSYTEHYDQVVNLEAGGIYGVELIQDQTGRLYEPYWYIWIDFNDDNYFAESEKVFTADAIANALSGFDNVVYMRIPANAPQGYHKMRIIQSLWNEALNGYFINPCNTFQYGEVEDYTVCIGGCDGITNPNLRIVEEFGENETIVDFDEGSATESNNIPLGPYSTINR